jgi:hypothetical protein
LEPCDFCLFGPCKKHPAGKKFPTDADVKQAVTWLQIFDTDFFYIRIQALVPRWCSCLNVSGDYAEVWYVPSATHGPRADRSQNNAVGINVFVTYVKKIGGKGFSFMNVSLHIKVKVGL